MEMFDYYKKVLTNYAGFEGRARRSEFWYFLLFNIIIAIILGVVDGMIGLATFGIADIYSLAVLVPSIAVAIRRMHDIGKSGWFILIPFYNLYLFSIEGEKGTNEYGPNPKNPEMDDVLDHLVEN
jgi:uncharacterized membrane protein YhaH (DUF805 family)